MGRTQQTAAPEPESSSSLDLRPIRVEKTFVSISNEIKRLIFSGALKPGDRLPSELDLAERLGVSRPSVREALRVLELSGFLQVQRGGSGGRVIVDTIAASIGNSLLDAVQLSHITTDELTVARIEIESVILKHAVARADESDLEALRENIETANRKVAAGESAADANIEFHKILAKAAKNHVLSLLLEALILMLRSSMGRLRMIPSTEKSREFTRAHEYILAALVARNPEVAVERMKAHLSKVTSRLQEPSAGNVP
jgi:GntR family transcriptional regulator, transcriptional repressor for pyruvate dehydrogenase complex